MMRDPGEAILLLNKFSAENNADFVDPNNFDT